MKDTRDLLTICTATIGDTCGNLNRQMFDLRAFTDLDYRQIVSDDGSLDEWQKQRQQQVCKTHGAVWTENPGPIWGCSYNWNHLFEQVGTPWAFCVEDGLRPSLGWLEAAVDAIERIGSRRWLGYPVGIIGTASFEDWHLAMARVLPTKLHFMDYCHRTTAETYSAFWGGEGYPNWNDGLWCWKRILPALHRACVSVEAESWPGFVNNFRDMVRVGYPHPGRRDMSGFQERTWPRNRTAGCTWFPGAFMLVNMEAWRKVGRFRDGCTFFEGHLGIRMAQNGYLSLITEFPPWLHYAGMGFCTGPRWGKVPRHHEACDGPGGLLERDFGCNGEGHEDLYRLVYRTFPLEFQREINRELAGTELAMRQEWEKWL